MKSDFFDEHPLAKQLVYMVIISVVIVFLAFMLIKVFARQGKEYELPDLRGESLKELKHHNPYHLKYVIIDSVYDAESEGGIVIQQDPKPGTMIKTRRKVYVTVTTFAPSDAILPELANMSVRSAVSALDAAGLKCGRLRFVESPYRNIVIEATSKGKLVYAGEKMDQGASVDLTVGLGEGRAYTLVPFVIGQSPAKARKGILSASLNVGQEHFEGVSNRNSAVCYKLSPAYTGVSRYPMGTYVDVWYCEASEVEAERIVQSFKVDSSQIIYPEDEEGEDETYVDYSPDYDDGWEW